MAKMGEEEVDYESDLEEEKRPLGLRRREAASDDEEVDGELEKKRLGLDRRAPIHSDDESDDQGGAADYDEEDEEEEPLDGGEEEVYGEDEEDGYVVGNERDHGEEIEGFQGQKEENTIPVRGEAGEVEGGDRDMEGGNLEDGMEDREDEDIIGEEGDEEGKKENEPFAVPTAGAFYMHDDRFRESSGGRNRRTYGGQKLWESKDDKRWGHDKFEEMSSLERHHDQGRRNSRGSYRGRGGKSRGPEQGYGRRSSSGAFSNGNNQSQGPKSVRGRGPRKYEPNWKNSSPAPSLQNKRAVEKTSHGLGRAATATVMSNPESDQVPPATKHSSLNSASPPFYPSGSSSKDATVTQKNNMQSGSASRNNVQQTGPLARGKNVSDTVAMDKLYIDDRAPLSSGKAFNNIKMPLVSSSMVNNSSQTSQTRAHGRAVPVSGQVGYQSTVPQNQVNRTSQAAQHHAVQRGVSQSRVQSSAQAPSQQSSQRSGGGSRASSPPSSAMSENSYEHGEAESTSESSKSRTALVGQGKGPFMYGGAQVVATSGAMGVVPGDQNFPARPAFFPVMQIGGQHPGGMGVPALGMAFPGYVAQNQHGLGNSEMTWLPVLTGAAGALGAAYCPSYLTVDGSSYHALPAGQASSTSSSSKETNASKSNNELKPSQRPGRKSDLLPIPRVTNMGNDRSLAGCACLHQALCVLQHGVLCATDHPKEMLGKSPCGQALQIPLATKHSAKQVLNADKIVTCAIGDLIAEIVYRKRRIPRFLLKRIVNAVELGIVMEESTLRTDLHVNTSRQSPLRPNGNLKSMGSAGRTTPRNSPTYRRLNSSRTPRREGRGSGGGRFQWFRSNRIVYWLLLITLWTYLGFYVQSRWAHGINKDEFLGFGGRNRIAEAKNSQENNNPRVLLGNESSLDVNGSTIHVEDGKGIEVVLAKKEYEASNNQSVVPKKKEKRSVRRQRGRGRGRKKAKIEVVRDDVEVEEPDVPKRNTSYGLLVGPFGTTEDKVLEWSPEKRSGTCDRKGAFARLVWSRKFVLIFHELSMTGAPLSMLELASELLSCGATVSVVVLSRKGGLMPELTKRRIKVLDDKADFSFKTAMKADLVIAGSAVCASWIDQYITRFPAGGSQIVWWIMENRREYFDRSKIVLDRVKMLVFLSESQARQWQTWCEGESIKLRSPPAVVELSVNDELAFVAGIPCSLNSPSSSPEKMVEKKQLLRDSVRREMGLNDSDMLVMSLSSINPGKGQLLLLESAKLLIEHDDLQKGRNSDVERDLSDLAGKHHLRSLLQDTHLRRVLSYSAVAQESKLKVLVGSVGSKSNKVPYVKELLGFLSRHSNLSKSVLWTPATTRVASLYSAADVYVINSQVLGTEAGGTIEIVENNVTGLLHPVGRPGSRVLAENLRFLLENPEVRKEMGMKGRQKVERKYLKKHMYKKFGEVLYKCMQIK
ncbi:unnamed protein product [Linum tenue]|uniref:Btz domain-containing protein n=1 Tax=Linum tenue TaxID=586396 RepID=A0AAV0KKX1_9ROSI|nr:unnamed protein product [Linum tenue]